MRVIICGSRGIKGPEGMQHVMDAIAASGFTVTEIVTGGAEGVDELADAWAKEAGIDRVIFPGNWKGKGKAAGYKRNQKMAWYVSLFMDQENPPENLKGGCIAVWNGVSKGTGHMIDIATENSLPLYVHPVAKAVVESS